MSPYTISDSRDCLNTTNSCDIILVLLCRTTILWVIICLHSSPGYHPWIPAYDIPTFKSAVSAILVNGSWRLRNSGNGADRVGKVKAIRRSCFFMEIPGSERPILGNEDYSPEGEANLC